MASPVGDEVRAFAPATVANLGPGFDVLGLALVGPGDTVTARRVDGQGVRLVSVSGADLPLDPERNTASVAAAATLRKAGVDVGVEIELEKGLPIGSWMGSSAASAASMSRALAFSGRPHTIMSGRSSVRCGLIERLTGLRAGERPRYG